MLDKFDIINYMLDSEKHEGKTLFDSEDEALYAVDAVIKSIREIMKQYGERKMAIKGFGVFGAKLTIENTTYEDVINSIEQSNKRLAETIRQGMNQDMNNKLKSVFQHLITKMQVLEDCIQNSEDRNQQNQLTNELKSELNTLVQEIKVNHENDQMIENDGSTIKNEMPDMLEYERRLRNELDQWLSERSSWDHNDWLELMVMLRKKELGEFTASQEGREFIGNYLEKHRHKLKDVSMT